MKFLILLTLIASTAAFANNGKVDYCNCYKSDGTGDMVQFARNNLGQIKGVNVYSTGKEAQKYTTIKDQVSLNQVVSKFYRSSYKSSNIASAEVILIVRNPSTGRERHLIIFRDKKGALISISENWGGRVSECDQRSLCAASDGSIVETVK
jgi:hypothetical protein